MTVARHPLRRRVLAAASVLTAMSAGARGAGLLKAVAGPGGLSAVPLVAGAQPSQMQPQTQSQMRSQMQTQTQSQMQSQMQSQTQTQTQSQSQTQSQMQMQPQMAQVQSPSRPLSGELPAALQEGGCVLLLRHARTEPGIGDPPGFRLADCTTQRNLSDEGRAQSRALGEALRRASVPIGVVRSSRWCRCLDTATLAFGRVEPWPVLDSFFAERRTEPVQTDALRDWVRRFRGPGNAALVTHQVNITALTGEGVGMGEVIVLRASDAGFRLIGRFGG
jgi:phosphohistidine phosphatase SixA